MNIWNIILILIKFTGALILFIYGMKLMSEGLQKVAGNKMRGIMGNMGNSPFRGITVGAAVTATIQSSTATTVMVVSLVNSGLLTLAGAIAVIMGANIGTTITSWIILFVLHDGLGILVLPLLAFAVAAPFVFMKSGRSKSVSEFVIGFGLLMLGIQLMQMLLPGIGLSPAISLLDTLSGWGIGSILLFILIGASLTVLVQVSSAVMAITLIMTAAGWLSYEMAAALVLGQNLGTTLTANMAASVANTAGKKAARAHFVFNLTGTLLTLLLFCPILGVNAYLTEVATHTPASFQITQLPTSLTPLAITLFNTLFNVVNAFVLSFFIPQFIRVVNWMVKNAPGESDDEFRLLFIRGGFTNTSELNIQAAQKEIENFSSSVLHMFSILPTLQTAKSNEEFSHAVARIQKYESITDRMEMEISKFLTKTAACDISEEASRRVSSMFRIVDNLESIGDTIFQIAMTRKNKRESAVHFDQGLNDNLCHMAQLVQNALDIMNSNLNGNYARIDIEAAYSAEQAINHYRDMLRTRHLDALKLGVYDFGIGNAYSSLYALYEKLGDYIINVSEAMDDSIKTAETLGDPNAHQPDLLVKPNAAAEQVQTRLRHEKDY